MKKYICMLLLISMMQANAMGRKDDLEGGHITSHNVGKICRKACIFSTTLTAILGKTTFDLLYLLKYSQNRSFARECSIPECRSLATIVQKDPHILNLVLDASLIFIPAFYIIDKKLRRGKYQPLPPVNNLSLSEDSSDSESSLSETSQEIEKTKNKVSRYISAIRVKKLKKLIEDMDETTRSTIFEQLNIERYINQIEIPHSGWKERVYKVARGLVYTAFGITHMAIGFNTLREDESKLESSRLSCQTGAVTTPCIELTKYSPSIFGMKSLFTNYLSGLIPLGYGINSLRLAIRDPERKLREERKCLKETLLKWKSKNNEKADLQIEG